MRIIRLGCIVLTSEQPALETQEGVCTCSHGMAGTAGVGEETRADVGSLLDSWPFPTRQAPLSGISATGALCVPVLPKVVSSPFSSQVM